MRLSRRDFLAAAAAAAGTFARPSFAVAGWQQATFAELRRNVGYFTMRGGTIGYLVDPGAVVVVDSQFPAEARAFLGGLNERSGGRAVDCLINTHHHGDHTGGNAVFRGVARRVVAHEQAAEHMRHPPGAAPAVAQPGDEPLYPDTTFIDVWSADVGGERVIAQHFGRAHTGGDIVVTFERANVVHMGDLMFHRRHPVVDRAAGATLRGWMGVLDRTVREHAADTIYIFGHANTGLPVVGDRADLVRFRDYFDALLSFVGAQIRAGRGRDEILAMRDPLAGFEEFGRFGQPGPRDALTCAYEEVAEA
jgi:cyclase